jgi:hypothetical protein
MGRDAVQWNYSVIVVIVIVSSAVHSAHLLCVSM